MKLRSLAPALAAALAAGSLTLAVAQDAGEDSNDLASLEKLARFVELHGHVDGKRWKDDLTLDKLGELGLPNEVRFPAVKSSLEAEGEFTKKYYEEYLKLFEETGKRCREVAKEADLFKDAVKGDDGVLFAKAFLKKYPMPKRLKKGDAKKLEKDKLTNEVRGMVVRLTERWEKTRDGAKRLQGKALEAELKTREEKARAFLKRYDYGKGVATTRLDGSANLHVDLPKATYEVVKKNLNVLNSTPLTDAKGKALEWAKKPLHGSSRIDLFDLKKALEDLSEHEYYVVKYAEKEGDEEKSLMRLTGARLLLGTYHVVEAPDRVVVYVPEREGEK